MNRSQSLVAWLASFGGAMEGLRGDLETAGGLLADGKLLLSLLRCLENNGNYEHEYGPFLAAVPEHAWVELLPCLKGLPRKLSRNIETMQTCSSEQLLQVLECFLGTVISPETAGQAQSIQHILSLGASEQLELKAVIEERMAAAASQQEEDEKEDVEEEELEQPARATTQEEAAVPAAGKDDDAYEDDHHAAEEEAAEPPITPSDVESAAEGEGLAVAAKGLSSSPDNAESPAVEEDEDSLPPTSATAAWQKDDVVSRMHWLERENAKLRESEATALERERQAQVEVEELRQSLLRGSLSGEVHVMELEEKYKQEVAALNKKLAATDKQASEMEQCRDRMEKLQDEIDVLRPFPQRLEVAEGALARCRDKIQTLQDVKEQLLQEQAAHADLLERSLRQERDLQQLPVLKRQVDTYKQSVTDLELSSRELQACLSERDAEVATLRTEIEGLKEARQAQLEKEMAAVKTGGGGGGGLSGIGDGVSECNPEVLEHIRTLEERCESLQSQVSDTAVDRLEKLSSELDDAKRLASSFEDMYRKTRGELQDMTGRMEAQTQRADMAEEEAKLLSETIDLLEADAAQRAREAGERAAMGEEERATVFATVRELHAALDMSQAEIDQRVYHHGRVSRCEFDKSKAAAWLSSLGMSAVIKELKQEVEATARALDETRQCVESEKATKQAAEMCVVLMRKDVERTQQSAEQAVAAARAEAETRLRDLQEQAMAAIKEREVQYHQAVQRLSHEMHEYKAVHDAVTNEQYAAERDSHQRALQAKEREVASLMIEVDELKMIQQRLEKEKRFLREEAQSMLAQERVASGNGGASQSVSASDLEGLQSEFQSLLKEHKALKRQVRAAEEGIGFSLADFEPKDNDGSGGGGQHGRSNRCRGPLEREFQVSLTPGGLDDSCHGQQRGGKGCHRSLKTPPERIPVSNHDDSSIKIDQLVDERRAMFLDLTAAHTKVKKLESSVAALEAQLSDKDASLTSMNLKVARLQRQLDMITEQQHHHHNKMAGISATTTSHHHTTVTADKENDHPAAIMRASYRTSSSQQQRGAGHL